jgi:hypothetical protein
MSVPLWFQDSSSWTSQAASRLLRRAKRQSRASRQSSSTSEAAEPITWTSEAAEPSVKTKFFDERSGRADYLDEPSGKPITSTSEAAEPSVKIQVCPLVEPMHALWLCPHTSSIIHLPSEGSSSHTTHCFSLGYSLFRS